MPDDAWPEESAPRDAQAFEALYSTHFGRVRNFLKLYLNNAAAGEDIAQDTFLQFWKRPHGFDPRRSSLGAYLFGIARKKAADWYRRQAPDGESSLDAARSLDSSSALLMDDALQHLDPQLRVILWLREVEGYSYNELAGILEIPVGTVKSRLFCAREQLRTIWSRRELCDALPRS